ncbi:MAG: tyrosine-type recombinase/integrase [Myxococcota bacterium]
MTLHEHVEVYLAAMQTRGLAGLTIRNQRSHLTRFAAFLEGLDVTDVGELVRDHVEAYMDELASKPTRSGRPMKPETRNVRLSSIKAFCRRLTTDDLIAIDPAESVAYCREPTSLPKNILSEEEMRKLLAAPDPQTLIGFRDRVALELLYSTAVRVAELCGLDVVDVETGEGFARVRHGKGDQDRVVPVGKLACELVQSYLGEVRPALLARRRDAKGELALILSQYGARLGRAGVAKLITRHVKTAGLTGRVTPPTFRHACATHMLRGGANVRHLQEMLGHKKLTSTEIYTRVTITELKEVHARFHPRGSVDEVDIRPPRPERS